MNSEQLSVRLRGLMLGLALGDSLGQVRGQITETGPLLSGVTTQLAAYTAEGLARASMRMNHRGICHPPGVIWHAYRRWAAGQGIAAAEQDDVHGATNTRPDGWLAQVPLLRERRGSAPTTVRMIQQGTPGKPTSSVSTSMGCHALTRALPIAVLGSLQGHRQAVALAKETAALTHGTSEAQDSAADAVDLLAHALVAADVDQAVNDAIVCHIGNLSTAVNQAQQAAQKNPRQHDCLTDLAPTATAQSALKGAVYVASSFPDPDAFIPALRFASQGPDGVAATAGAILGTLHGAHQLPIDLVSRHELAWVLDTLATDLLRQLTDSPGGSEYEPPRDPLWWNRYPGW